MNLTIAEIRELPLPAALFDRDGELIASTPEWQGAGPGTVLFALRGTRLAVASEAHDPASATLLDRLLDAMEATADESDGIRRRRIAMLTTSLRLVAGRRVRTSGTSHDVIDLAVAGITARTGLKVRIDGRPAFPVHAPEVAALALVQLAVNAERHTRTTSVTLVQDEGAFHVVWPGEAGRTAPTTARSHRDRQRWGLGFCRIAADTLGGAVYPPADRGDGSVAATLELGLHDLALPIAAIRAIGCSRRLARGTRRPGACPVRPSSLARGCRHASRPPAAPREWW